MTLIKVGSSDDDNIRSNTEYNLIPMAQPVISKPMWFRSSTDKNVLYYTEPVVKFNKSFIKTKRCKYLTIE